MRFTRNADKSSFIWAGTDYNFQGKSFLTTDMANMFLSRKFYVSIQEIHSFKYSKIFYPLEIVIMVLFVMCNVLSQWHS